jgi:hypothetical protein
MQGLSSFGAFMEETVQTEYPASVFSGASFWNYAENLWHCRPPYQKNTSVNGRPTANMGHHVKEEIDELGNVAPFIYNETEYCDVVT